MDIDPANIREVWEPSMAWMRLQFLILSTSLTFSLDRHICLFFKCFFFWVPQELAFPVSPYDN